MPVSFHVIQVENLLRTESMAHASDQLQKYVSEWRTKKMEDQVRRNNSKPIYMDN